MTVNAHVERGKLIFDQPVSFPDGTKLIVRIEPMRTSSETQAGASTFGFWDSPTLDDIAARTGGKTVFDPSELLGGWPGDVDDGFEEFVAKIRRTGSVGVD